MLGTPGSIHESTTHAALGVGGRGFLFAVKNPSHTQHRRNCHREHPPPQLLGILSLALSLPAALMERGQCHRTETACCAGLSRIYNVGDKLMLLTMCLTTRIILEP